MSAAVPAAIAVAAQARPAAAVELAAWYLMRCTGVMLFVLALSHFSILHFIWDPAEQTPSSSPRSAGTRSSGAASTGCC